MARKRHYVKIPPTLTPYVPGGAVGKWQQTIWNDITSGGRELCLEFLDPNEKGDRTAIHGDRFYVEIGRDRERVDTVFMMRVQKAELRLPRSTPVTVSTELVMWPGSYPPDLDVVDDLFLVTQHAASESPTPIAVEVSPLLMAMLANLPDAIRQKLRPGTDVKEAERPQEFLGPLRQLRARHRLDRYLRASPRQDMLLRTATTPPELSRSERDGLLAAFGTNLLNEVALADDKLLRAVLESLAAFAIPPRLRAEMWTASLDGLERGAFRRELHECADALARLAGDVSELEVAWQEVAAPGLRRRAQKIDAGLAERLAEVSSDCDTLAAIASWSRDLAFSDAPAGTGDVTAPDRPVTVEHAVPVRDSVADEWVMKLRLPDLQPLEELRSALMADAALLRDGSGRLDSVEALLAFDRRVAAVAACAQRWRESVGGTGALRDDLEECRTALAELERALGADAERLICTQYVLPSEAVEIARVVGHPMLGAVPDWLIAVGSEGELPSRPATPGGWANLLVHNERRRCVQMFCDLATELNEPQAVQWLTAPAPGGEVEAHLRDWYEQVRSFLLDLPAEMRGLIGSGATFQQTRDHAELLAQVRDALPPTIWPEVEQELREADAVARSVVLAAYRGAVSFFRAEVDGWESLPYSAIRNRAQKEIARQEVPTSLVRAASSDSYVTAEHNFLERRTSRATLHFSPSESGEDYGSVTVPLVLETEQPRPLSVELQWEFKGAARVGWSRDWPAPEPGDGDVISIPMLGWRRQPDDKRWHFCLAARLPIRAPREANPRLEVEVTVLDADARRALGPRRVLKWESIGLRAPAISVIWGDATEPARVREHPIGPQERADAVRDRFAAGSNVAVIAPRRFGKSTLVEYLVKEGNKSNLLVPPAMVCTRYRGAAGFDYERFWGELSDRFVDLLGVRLKYESAGALPPPEAFDDVRLTARRKRYEAVVILLDEAQLFFAGGAKADIGAQLKTLLERSLSRTDDTKKAPLVVGLIGLPSLRERAGNDLMAVLNPIEKSRMDESELSPLIAKMTTGLQTTKGARQRLADTAGNLLILKAMLESLATRASREKRAWVNLDDVVAVEELLKKELKDGRELTVASYVRDVLNAADSVDDWRPIPSLPAAAAWAHTWIPGRPDQELHERALDLLNEWCRLSYGGDEQGVRPVYTMDLLYRHLRQLRERQVLDESEFVSPLLRAWLSGIAARRNFDASFRDVLFSGAQRRIKLPSGAAPVAQGSEASIWRSGDRAYRVRELAGADQREQFLESIEMLETLRQVVNRRDIGSDHVFELHEMGLSDRNDREAIQVYRWVEGQPLSLREGGLAAEIVIDIGTKLARAVRLLHRHGLLHRDISPRNIVLDDVTDSTTIRPVLLDFGFARMVSTSMHTSLAGQHVAPEVRGTAPDWRRPADIYALSSTLLALLDGKDAATDLREVLDTGTSERPDDRPTAEQLLDALEKLARDRAVAENRERAWDEVWQTVRELRHLPWFSKQMTKMREHLIGVWLRHYRIPIHRYGVLCDFLNQLTEACPAVGRPAWTLGIRDSSDELRAVGALRNQHVHGGGMQTEEQRITVQRFMAMDPERQETLLRNGAARIAVLCQLKPLPALVERLLG